jgi:hypothetical protein
MDAAEQQNLLDEIHAEVKRLGAVVEAPTSMLADRHRSPSGTWIELYWREAADGDDEDGWYIALMRREDGHDWELAEVAADEPDYLLYVLFDEVTARLAKATTSAGDRRIWFAEQQALLGRLNEQWRERTARRHAEMLSI